VPVKPPSAGPTARIDDTVDAAVTEPQWEVILNYQDAEGGDATWTLKTHDSTALERAKASIEEVLEHAQAMPHVGFLTLPDRSLFPRIVGAKGSNVARLRNETGADIIVSKEDTTIAIIGVFNLRMMLCSTTYVLSPGTESNIEAAKEAILEMASNLGRSQRRK